MLKSKAGLIAEVNFKPKAELGKENKTHPPGDVSETLPYLYKGWLLYTSGWDVEWRIDFAKFGDSLKADLSKELA